MKMLPKVVQKRVMIGNTFNSVLANREADKLDYWPVMSIGLSYRF